jgi:peptide/nickel transport system permease protein/peptide/nickel transport system substrate-binding protein
MKVPQLPDISLESLGNLSRREALGLAGLTLGTLMGLPALAQDRPRQGGILKVSANSNPSTLDPARGSNGFDHVFLWTMFDTLVEWDAATLKPKPGMAEWTFPDANTMLLNLKPGIMFHDGTPCDAQAVKFNLDRSRSDTNSNIRAELVNVSAVTVVSPTQVKLTLSQPDAALPAILSDRAGMMASPKALTESGLDFGRKPVGAGPWKFVSWTDNQKVVVTRNTSYWRGGLPYLDGIEMAIIPELPTGLRSVVSKQNQLVFGLPSRSKTIIERDSSLNMVSGATLYCHLLFINYAKAPLNNTKVRQAINLAIDRQEFVKGTMDGAGEPAHMLVPKSYWIYDKDVAALTPHDPARARKLLEEAGFASGLDLTIACYSDQDSVRRGEILIEQLGKVGIRAKLVNGIMAEISAQYFNGDKRFDLHLSFWSGRPDPSMTYSLMFSKGSFYNAGRTEFSPELTSLLQESRTKEDQVFRRGVFAKIQRIVMENGLVAPLAIQYQLAAAVKQVRGFEGNLLGKPRFNNIWLQS